MQCRHTVRNADRVNPPFSGISLAAAKREIPKISGIGAEKIRAFQRFFGRLILFFVLLYIAMNIIEEF